MNYYPFHVGDYMAHTAHLEPLEDIAYRRLLDSYYLREQPIPASPEDAARLIRMKGNVDEVKAVLAEFFQLTPEGWRHGRCDLELAKMQEKQAKARASAEASVSARRANAQRTLSERSTDVELPTPTPTPIPIPTPEDQEREAPSAPPAAPAPAQAPPADCEPIPLNDGTEFLPTADQFGEFLRLFPAVDVRAEIRKMRAWAIGNPSKRKTRRGVMRFMSSWLAGQQDRARDPPQRPAPRIAQNFADKTYTGSTDDQLPAHLRP